METLWLFVAAFSTAALGGVLGMANGIFIVPILTQFFGVPIHVAIPASIVAVIACSCGSAAPLLKTGLTNIRLAVVLEMATTLGAVTGVFLIGMISEPVLYGLFAAILALSARQMLGRRQEAILPAASEATGSARILRLNSSFPDHATGREIPYQIVRVPLGMGLMYGAGLLSALLGIGSGILKIPAMDAALRLPIKVSSATSNFMIGVTAAASGGAYFMRGDIDIGIAAPVALGSVIGALLGARLLIRIAPDSLRVFFVIVLAVLGVQMLFSAFGIHLAGAET